MRTGAYSSAAALTLFLAACGQASDNPQNEINQPTGDRDGAASDDASALSSTPVINRVIPIRFVQFTSSSSPALSLTDLQEQVDGVNATFVAAGIQFYIDSTTSVADPVFASVSRTGNYTWPSPTSSATPLTFNPGCSTTFGGVMETEEMALFRAGSYCAKDGEVIIFTVESYGGSRGVYPWEANAIIMQRGDMHTGWRTLAHEMGHYLGLSHSFRGEGASYDLGNANLRIPEPNSDSGRSATLSDFWDLIYKPADVNEPSEDTANNVYFNNQVEAMQYGESSLRPISGNANWVQNVFGYVCYASESNCPAGKLDGTLRLAVPRSAGDYTNCNLLDASTFSQDCVCVTNPSSCDTLYTGDPGLKGLGFTLPGHTLQNPNFGANVMSYNYHPGFIGDHWWLSQTQIAQVKRVLTHDIDSSWFSGTTGRRPRLGNGLTGFSNWESLGGNISGKPAVVASSSGMLDVIMTSATDSGGYNKVLNVGSSSSWWPSQTDWASIGGALDGPPSAVRRGDALDVVARSTNGAGYNKVWDPTNGWWPGQLSWTSVGGSLESPLVAASWGTDRLDVFAAGDTNNIVHKFWESSASAWSPSQLLWSDIGAPTPGASSDAPSVSTWGSGHLDIIALGTDNAAYNKVLSSSGWWPSQTTWSGLGSKQFEETPALVSWSVNHLYVVGRGTDHRAWSKFWVPSAWSPSQTGWYDLGGDLAGPVSMVAWGSGRLDMVARGTDGSLLYKSWDSSNGGWWPSQTGWAKLALDIGGDPVIVTSGSGKLDIFVRGSDGALWHRSRKP